MESYTVSEVARRVGVTEETIKLWEARKWIPLASRVGLRKKRVWNHLKADSIFQFARDNGYTVR